MKLVKFKEHNLVFAENQPEYLPLPAYMNMRDPTGTIICCWKLSWRERLKVLFTGTIWHRVLTFRLPLQPLMLMVDKPEMKPDNEPIPA